MLNIGLISYLNAFPYNYPLLNNQRGQGKWQFHIKRPGILNKMMREGELDASFVSAMEYASNPQNYWIIPGLSLSSRGYVDSVRLVSDRPIEELSNTQIHITGASATSVAALKILLHEEGIKDCTFSTFNAEDIVPKECHAALVIGDEALRLKLQEFPFNHSYDIGELWQKSFNRNIVFAIGIIRRTHDEQKLGELSQFCEFASRCPELSFADESSFTEACATTYPNIKEPLEYLRLLHYGLDQQASSNLKFFFEKAHQIGLINQAAPLEFFTIAPEWA